MNPSHSLSSSSSGSERDSFFLDTRGLCFMCLKVTETNADPLDNYTFPSSFRICSFQSLSRYLDINFDKVFQTSVRLQSLESLIKTELLVSVCGSCSVEVEKFSDLFQELELIKMRLSCSVQTILGKVMDGENDKLLMQEYRKRMRTNDHSDILQTEMIENLRKETIEKCSSLIQKAQPRVEVKRLVNLNSSSQTERNVISNTDCDYVMNPIDSEEMYQEEDDRLVSVSEIPNKNNNCSSALKNHTITSSAESDADPKFKPVTNNRRSHPWPVKPHTCSFCSRAFRNSSDLRTHTITQHYEQSFIHLKDPDLPNDLFRAAVDLILISEYIVQDLPEAETESSHSSSKKRYYCSHCRQPYRHKTTMRIHIVQVHYNEVRLKLLEVQKNPDLSTLKEHAKLLANNVQKETVNKIGISEEIKSTGLEDARGVDANLLLKRKSSGSGRPKKPPDIFTTTCSSCNLTLPTRSDWIKHTRLECKDNEFISSSCSPSTSNIEMEDTTRSFWKRHVIPRLNCDVCRKKFYDHDTLNKHKSIQHPPNSTSKDFQCEYCISKFRFFFAYRIHLLTTHRLKVFTDFARPGTKKKVISDSLKIVLQTYAKQSDGENQSVMHVCSLCSKKFVQALELENHIVVAHFDEVVAHLIEISEGNNQSQLSSETETSCDDKINNPTKMQEVNTDNCDSFVKIEENDNPADIKHEINMEEDNASFAYSQLHGDNCEAPVDPFSIL